MEKEINAMYPTVGELVAADFRKAEFFKKNGIDFCCGGGKTLDEVCKRKGLDIQSFLQQMEEFSSRKTNSESQNFNNWNLAFLADYIENVHHSYIKESTPFLKELSEKVARVHGHGAPVVILLRKLFANLTEELTPHMVKEERILFPYIRSLVQSRNPKIDSEFIIHPISMMESEHDTAGNIMKLMMEETENFSVPEYACNSWRVLYQKLNEFADDLFTHIHLENNILFPKAIKLEKEILEKTLR